MKHQFNLFQRAGVFYCEDTTTGKQTSLRTKDKADALRLLHAKNEAVHQPAMNLQIAQVYLQHGDSALATRTWQEVMEQIAASKTGSTQARWQTAIKDKALDVIRHRRLIETTPEHFLAALKAGGVATNVYLRRIHHYAIALHWLPWPVLPKRHWPAIQFHDKRAIMNYSGISAARRRILPGSPPRILTGNGTLSPIAARRLKPIVRVLYWVSHS